jgi:hypothetical protein
LPISLCRSESQLWCIRYSTPRANANEELYLVSLFSFLQLFYELPRSFFMKTPTDLRLSLAVPFVDKRHLRAFVPYRVGFLELFYKVQGSILNERGTTIVILFV